LKNRRPLANQLEIVKEQLNQIHGFAERLPKDCRTILVEKTDRLYRNLKDWVTLDEIDVDIHLVKEGDILNKASHSSQKFFHGIRVLMAKNYIENLSEETRKGMTEKAFQGEYPTRAPFGYRNNTETHNIEPDPVTSKVIPMLFEEYATGKFNLVEVRNKLAEHWPALRMRIANIPKSSMHRMLQNPVYTGEFYWSKKLCKGTFPSLISRELWEQVQKVLHRQNKPHPQHRKFAFGGLLFCGYCGCMMTAEIHKGRYVYYRCTGGKGKCAQKYIREERLAELLGECIKKVEIGEDVVEWLSSALKESHNDEKAYHNEQIVKLQEQHSRLQKRLEQMYDDKLDGKITQELFEHKSDEWRKEQDELKRRISNHENADRDYIDQGILLLRLSTKAYSIYQRVDLFEKRNLLDFVLSNSTIKDEEIKPVYRQPFDILVNTKDSIEEKRHFPQGEMPVRTVWGG
ncbi:MAG: recombinase family protein, partial [Chitinispirillaceae bacterium]|nr:recombinase family protein [Chitinispirillaceae bacterium]